MSDMKLFNQLEAAILQGLADVADEIGETEGDLITLVAVFAKLAADAAIDYGVSEEHFVNSMRHTYQAVLQASDEETMQ